MPDRTYLREKAVPSSGSHGKEGNPIADQVKGDAKGQFAGSRAKPNPEGLSSANPVAVSGNGDATFKGDPHEDKADPEKNEP